MAVQNFPRESWDESHDLVCIIMHTYIYIYIERERPQISFNYILVCLDDI